MSLCTPGVNYSEITEATQPCFGGRGMENFDLAIVGGGQGGLPAAALAARLGAKVALIEMREVGGT